MLFAAAMHWNYLQNRKTVHSDVDITLFNEDGKDIAGYILSKGWDDTAICIPVII